MTRAGAIPALLLTLVLVGCSPAAPLDLDVLSTADAPDGMTWTPSGAELTAGEDLEEFAHAWEDAGGAPTECLPLYLLAYGVQPTDTGSDDRTVEVGYFAPRQGGGAIMVNARDFDAEQGAIDFIQHALEAAGDCPGYTVSDLAVAPGGFAVARFGGGHGITGDGGATEVAARFAVVRHEATIIVVDAFLTGEAVGLDLTAVDEVARTVLERLSAGA